MNLKTFVVGLAFGGMLAACGPAEELPEPRESEVGTAEQGVCEGWDSGARRCSFKCTANGGWLFYDAGAIAYGGCRDAADAFCRGSAYAVCWSR